MICGHPTHDEVADILASHGAEKNVHLAGGGNALYVAASGGHAEAVKTMLQRGMDPSFKTPFLWYPLVSQSVPI